MGDLSSHALHNSDSAEPDSDSDSEPNSPRKTEVQDGQRPELVHRFQHDASILCLTTNEERIFAGTQSGEILVRLHMLDQACACRGALSNPPGIPSRHISKTAYHPRTSW